MASKDNAETSNAFTKLQLAIASVMSNPSLTTVLKQLDEERSSRSPGDDLEDAFASNGAPLPKDVKISLASGEAEARKITLTICATWNDTTHCASVTLQPPIEIETV